MGTFVVRVKLALILLCLLFANSTAGNRRADFSADEASLRAAIILKIIHLTSWPIELHKNINFCSSGVSPSMDKLREMQGTRITKQQAEMQILANDPRASEAKDCHVQILGAGGSTSNHQEALVVICDDCEASDAPNTTVELLKRKQNIRFNLNLMEAKKNNIRFSVSLLEHAEKLRGHYGK